MWSENDAMLPLVTGCAGGMMNCREFTSFLDGYLAGSLPAVIREEFDRHLAVCPHCVDYLKTYQTTINLARASMRGAGPAAGPVPPDELVQAVLASLRKN